MEHPWLYVICLLSLIGSTTSLGRAGEPETLRDAVECTPRQGLPNFFAKLAAGDEVRIAYLGGSITAQPGWRPQTLAWFQRQYPEAKVSEINAAIGGTGSMLGVFRLQHDVLQHKPDLLFVEFAVNDSGTPSASILQTMEGIVRQTWLANPRTDICFVYTLTQQMLSDLQHDKFPRAASVMERVADHYGIPSIHMGVEVARLEAAGQLVFVGPKPQGDAAEHSAVKIVFSGDGVHPYPETGHVVYTRVIARSMDKIKGVGKPADHCVCEPLVSERWQKATMVPLQRDWLGGDWQELSPSSNTLARQFANRMPGLWQAGSPGDTLTFHFRGTAVGFYDLLGPDCGQLTIQVDDRPPITRPRFDGYCSYHRLSLLMVASDLPDADHTVKVSLDAQAPDKAKILQPQRREDLEKNPAKYAGLNWYVGGIMLIGEPLEQP